VLGRDDREPNVLELQKAVETLLLPLGASTLLGIGALAAGFLRHRHLAMLVGVAAVSWLLLWSLPPASRSLRFFLEPQVPAKPASELPTAGVIVVLGGGIGGPVPPLRPYPDMNSASDRIWHAARLYHAGKAPKILLSGGQALPNSAGDDASAMAGLLKDFGVPVEALILEKQSRTTSENARETTIILNKLGIRRVLLVTSALHMPRALLSFANRGFEVIPATTDVEVFPHPLDITDWLPEADALDGSSRAIHEILGIARCRLVGC
jgi:uncharacterized SAM-binding protein YcdF (DUF218 family)